MVKPDRRIVAEVQSQVIHPLMRETVLTAAAHDMRRIEIIHEEGGVMLAIIVRNKPIKKGYRD